MYQTLLLALPFAALALCAAHDVTSFKIPNRYVAVLTLAWPVAVLFAGAGLDEAGMAAACGGGLLILGFLLFSFGSLGAGDAKLLAAVGLWIGPAGLPDFLLYTALSGAALGIFLLQARRYPLPAAAARIGWVASLHERKRVMPYGVAIAVGGFLSLRHSFLLGT